MTSIANGSESPLKPTLPDGPPAGTQEPGEPEPRDRDDGHAAVVASPIPRRARPDAERFPDMAIDRIPPLPDAEDPGIRALPGIRRMECQASDSPLTLLRHEPRIRGGTGEPGVDVAVTVRNTDPEEARAAHVTVQLQTSSGEVLTEERRATGDLDPDRCWAATFVFDGLNLPPNVDSTLVIIHDQD